MLLDFHSKLASRQNETSGDISIYLKNPPAGSCDICHVDGRLVVLTISGGFRGKGKGI